MDSRQSAPGRAEPQEEAARGSAEEEEWPVSHTQEECGQTEPRSQEVAKGSQEATRRSTRIRKATEKVKALTVSTREQEEPEIPQTYREAIEDPVHGQKWKEAVDRELAALASFNTWRLEDLPAGKNLVSSRWVFSLKKDQQGRIVKFKARLVARGFSQRKGVDFEETFAPTVKYDSLRMALAIATAEDLEIHQVDVENAYLAADLEEEIFLDPPEGVQVPKGRVCRLQKGLYGLKQSARLWNKRITDVLVEEGFQQLSTDYSVLTKGGITKGLTVLVYVDDLLLLGHKLADVEELKALLKRQFKIKDLGEARSILNMQITRDRKKRELTLSQPGYTRQVLELFNMADCHPVKTPMEPGVLKALDVEYQRAKDSAENKLQKQYQEAIGSLMHLMVSTRPDIAYAVGRLSRYSQWPTDVHWKAVKRVFRYLAGTIGRGIQFRGLPRPIGYSDASHADDLNDRKSTLAYIFTMGGGAISWASKKSPVVALSSTEAEYMALTGAARQEAWINRQLGELQYRMKPGKILTDNQSSIDLAKNPKFHNRTKHIDTAYHYIRERVNLGHIAIEYMPSAELPADDLTKPLPAHGREKKLGKLGLT